MKFKLKGRASPVLSFLKQHWLTILILAVVVVFFKRIKNFIGSFFDIFDKGAEAGKSIVTTVTESLGLTTSSDKALVNEQYDSGLSPLSSSSFSVMQAKAPASAQLHSVGWMDPYISKLWDAMGFFFDEDDDAISVFGVFSTQYQVAYFAKRFNDVKGKDLFYWMRKSDTLFAQGFKAATVAEIVRKVNALPKY